MEPTFDVVLVAEDGHPHKQVADYLNQQGYAVHMIANGAALMKLIEQEPVDLVLLSVTSAETGDNGELIQQLRANPEWSHIGVTILSSSDLLPHVLEVIQHGADDYMIEPYEMPLLNAKINAVRARKSQRSIENAKLRKLERIADKMERIALRLGIELASETNFDLLLQKIVQEAMSMTSADAGALYMRTDDAGQKDQRADDTLRLTTYRTAAGVQTLGATPALPLYDKETGQPNVSTAATFVVTSAQAMSTPAIDDVKNFDFSCVRDLDAQSGHHTVSCLTVPILRDVSGHVIGVLQLFNEVDESGKIGPFASETVMVAQALAAQAAVAINNHLVLKQSALLAKLENDISIGRNIQLSFLPTVMPNVSGLEIGARFRPAREVAGDFYDVFMMMNRRKVGFFIGDVTDKGVGAALFMSLSRSLLRAFAVQNRNINWADTLFDGGDSTPGGRAQSSRTAINANALKTAVVSTNDYITEYHLDLNMFATLFFGMLDPNTGSLFYINGGHCPPFIVNKDGEIIERLEPTGPAIGMFPGAEFEIGETQLNHGEMLFLYTDGVTDARNPSGKFFSEAGVEKLVNLPITSAKDLLDRVDNTLVNFIREAAQFDDITMMALLRD